MLVYVCFSQQERNIAMESISFAINFKPTPWKRPAGKLVRYDSQINDKAAFGLKAMKAIYEKYPALRAAPRPWFGTAPLDVAITLEFDATGKTACQLPDIDNLAKFILDALQSQSLDGVIWTDDCQVVFLSAIKLVGDKDLINVLISRSKT